MALKKNGQGHPNAPTTGAVVPVKCPWKKKNQVQKIYFTLIPPGPVFRNYFCEIVSKTTTKTLRDPDQGQPMLCSLWDVNTPRSLLQNTRRQLTAADWWHRLSQLDIFT